MFSPEHYAILNNCTSFLDVSDYQSTGEKESFNVGKLQSVPISWNHNHRRRISTIIFVSRKRMVIGESEIHAVHRAYTVKIVKYV